MGPLFITGASGFVGRKVLEVLKTRGVADVRCLTRSLADLSRLAPPAATWRYVEGSISAPPRGALEGVHTVLHLAALTGKARPEAFRRVNVDGTRALLTASRAAGVPRFILVSSVAAGFSDRRHYPYGESKREAEALVRSSGLDFAIVRPTMVLGQGSPVFKGLKSLAALPVGIRFGRGRAQVQPVSVNDLAAILVDLCERPALNGNTYGVGGRESVRLHDLLGRIRLAARGRSGPWATLPLGPMRAVLSTLEHALFPVLPFTAGQLASFANEATATPDGAMPLHGPSGLDTMIAESNADR